MDLLPNELQIGLPKLYDCEDTPTNEMMLRIRFYDTNSTWEWYLIEFEPETNIAFGYVCGFEKEWGYFSIDELSSISSIKRDNDFQPITFEAWKKNRD